MACRSNLFAMIYYAWHFCVNQRIQHSGTANISQACTAAVTMPTAPVVRRVSALGFLFTNVCNSHPPPPVGGAGLQPRDLQPDTDHSRAPQPDRCSRGLVCALHRVCSLHHMHQMLLAGHVIELDDPAQARAVKPNYRT